MTSHKTKDNYYEAGKLYFNKYKTSNKYGLQIREVPSEVNNIIKKWLKSIKVTICYLARTKILYRHRKLVEC